MTWSLKRGWKPQNNWFCCVLTCRRMDRVQPLAPTAEAERDGAERKIIFGWRVPLQLNVRIETCDHTWWCGYNVWLKNRKQVKRSSTPGICPDQDFRWDMKLRPKPWAGSQLGCFYFLKVIHYQTWDMGYRWVVCHRSPLLPTHWRI